MCAKLFNDLPELVARLDGGYVHTYENNGKNVCKKFLYTVIDRNSESHGDSDDFLIMLNLLNSSLNCSIDIGKALIYTGEAKSGPGKALKNFTDISYKGAVELQKQINSIRLHEEKILVPDIEKTILGAKRAGKSRNEAIQIVADEQAIKSKKNPLYVTSVSVIMDRSITTEKQLDIVSIKDIDIKGELMLSASKLFKMAYLDKRAVINNYKEKQTDIVKAASIIYDAVYDCGGYKNVINNPFLYAPYVDIAKKNIYEFIGYRLGLINTVARHRTVELAKYIANKIYS